MFDRIHDFIRALFFQITQTVLKDLQRVPRLQTFKDLEAAEEEVKDREGVDSQPQEDH